MRYEKTLKISQIEADTINHYLTEEPEDWHDCLDEEDTIVYGVQFDDGKEMDIKCCGVEYREGESNLAWTEAVLFNENGSEICCTDVSDEYLGEWICETNGNDYVVNVVVE